MQEQQPILSICIPTYNRAEILRGNLKRIQGQLSGIDLNELELVVSDNCSPDNTKEFVQGFIQEGLPITYCRNAENIGASRNFLNCMHIANGKYIYLLGDDDYMKDGAIAFLLDCLRGKDYGLLHISTHGDSFEGVKEYTDTASFIQDISYWFTFMSGNVFRKDVVDKVDAEKYYSTHLLQMPFYLESVLSKPVNAMVSGELLEAGLAAAENGNYNLFEVFVNNYLSIMATYLKDDHSDVIDYLRRDIFENFLKAFYIKPLLIKREPSNFKTDRGWQILYKYYWKDWYFHKYLLKYPFGVIKRKIKKLTEK